MTLTRPLYSSSDLYTDFTDRTLFENVSKPVYSVLYKIKRALSSANNESQTLSQRE